MGNEKRTAGDFSSFQLVLFLLMIISGISIATNTITQSQGIYVGQTLISLGEIFELGFFSPVNSTNQYVGIWYKNISGQKPVWVANRENPLSISDTNSSLIIASDGNLRIINGMRITIWSTNISSQTNGTVAVLTDQGDLSLKDNISGLVLWDSFNYPGDTFISGMEIGTNTRTGENYFLTSWRTENDPSIGDFEMGVTNEKPPQAFIWSSSKPFWRSGPWDGWEFIGVNQTGVGYSNGIIVTQDNQQGSTYLTYNSHSDSYVTLVSLTPEGNLKMSHWTIGVPEGATWDAMEVPCDVYNTCGPFGFCDRIKTNSCQCLYGFVPKSTEEWNKGNWTDCEALNYTVQQTTAEDPTCDGGCVRRTELECTKNQSNEKNDGFQKLSGMKVPDHHNFLFNNDASSCKQLCLSNCSCMAYAYVAGIGCMVWGGELIDIQKYSSTGVDLYLRLAASELDKAKKKTKLITLVTTIPGVILLAAIAYGLYRCLANRKVHTSTLRRPRIKEGDFVVKTDNSSGCMLEDEQADDIESSDLPFFRFSTLAVATNDFSEENKLGAGGFGPVYKGKLENGQDIAIKRLSSHSGQGAIEFKNEIVLISKLQHRNLVKLIGYSIKGDEKLLIYEYLKNKSLDTFLFDKKKRSQLDWAKRFNIIEGIARGLLYLHRDSCLRIIHRDLKAGNILLDDQMNPKISDFGLARSFEVTQELATHRVVGTFGYMSPEYAVGGLFSEKSDVFSFGVLLLEIISGMKNSGFQYQEDFVNLLGYSWHLWNEGKGIELMDKELTNSCTESDFIKCMKIGLLCVSDYAMERPTMSSVVLMLTGEVEIPQPQQPTFYHSLLSSSAHSQSSNSKSKSQVSISMSQAR